MDTGTKIICMLDLGWSCLLSYFNRKETELGTIFDHDITQIDLKLFRTVQQENKIYKLFGSSKVKARNRSKNVTQELIVKSVDTSVKILARKLLLKGFLIPLAVR